MKVKSVYLCIGRRFSVLVEPVELVTSKSLKDHNIMTGTIELTDDRRQMIYNFFRIHDTDFDRLAKI